MFRFRHFSINDERCAMKIGTDGVLLGAWTNPLYAMNVLDIGTGSGLLALMMAQKSQTARILGVDIDQNAVDQAIENVENSKWKERICIIKDDFNNPRHLDGLRFDLVVSNPPFYSEHTHSANIQRDMARNAHSLPIENLVGNVAKLLAPNGRFSLIVPAELASDVIGEAAIHNIYLTRRCKVFSKPDTPPKRAMLEFARHIQPTCNEQITIFDDRDAYTIEFKSITKYFYL